MFGNHRDGWTFGASDPSSGTAVMMEIVRALGEYKKKGLLSGISSFINSPRKRLR